eukprot:3722671-Prymnesium_polylepis.1
MQLLAARPRRPGSAAPARPGSAHTPCPAAARCPVRRATPERQRVSAPRTGVGSCQPPAPRAGAGRTPAWRGVNTLI